MSAVPPNSHSIDLGTLTRFGLESNVLREGLEHSPLAPLLLSEADLERSLQSTLSSPHRGADVWLFRFEEREKILVPEMPALPDSPDLEQGVGGAAKAGAEQGGDLDLRGRSSQ